MLQLESPAGNCCKIAMFCPCVKLLQILLVFSMWRQIFREIYWHIFVLIFKFFLDSIHRKQTQEKSPWSSNQLIFFFIYYIYIYIYNYNLLNNTWFVQRPKMPREADLGAPCFYTSFAQGKYKWVIVNSLNTQYKIQKYTPSFHIIKYINQLYFPVHAFKCSLD